MPPLAHRSESVASYIENAERHQTQTESGGTIMTHGDQKYKVHLPQAEGRPPPSVHAQQNASSEGGKNCSRNLMHSACIVT